jgi:hypothetical protein
MRQARPTGDEWKRAATRVTAACAAHARGMISEFSDPDNKEGAEGIAGLGHPAMAERGAPRWPLPPQLLCTICRSRLPPPDQAFPGGEVLHKRTGLVIMRVRWGAVFPSILPGHLRSEHPRGGCRRAAGGAIAQRARSTILLRIEKLTNTRLGHSL